MPPGRADQVEMSLWVKHPGCHQLGEIGSPFLVILGIFGDGLLGFTTSLGDLGATCFCMFSAAIVWKQEIYQTHDSQLPHGSRQGAKPGGGLGWSTRIPCWGVGGEAEPGSIFAGHWQQCNKMIMH